MFTLRGIGTVATGTLWSGSMGVADKLRVEPGGLGVRVRSVHVHDRAVRRAAAGQRVAAALAGVRRRLATPVVAALGDRVVLRTHTTVGGGRVLDPVPPRHADRSRFELLERGELPAPRKPDALRPLPEPQPQTMDRARAHDAARLDESLATAGLDGLRIDDRALVDHLEREGRAVRLGAGYAVSAEAYEAARRALLHEAEREASITLARFRDRLGISRRPAQLLLERFRRRPAHSSRRRRARSQKPSENVTSNVQRSSPLCMQVGSSIVAVSP